MDHSGKHRTLIWSMFTTDREGYFHEGLGGESEKSEGRWPVVMKAGGVQPDRWPEWMRGFKEY